VTSPLKRGTHNAVPVQGAAKNYGGYGSASAGRNLMMALHVKDLMLREEGYGEGGEGMSASIKAPQPTLRREQRRAVYERAFQLDEDATEVQSALRMPGPGTASAGDRVS
jgi:hypothetical protein